MEIVRRNTRCVPIALIVLTPLFAHAADTDERSSPLVSFFWKAWPVVLFIAMLFFVFRRPQGSAMNAKLKNRLRRQGVGFLVMGVVFFLEAARFSSRQPSGAWLFAAYATVATLVGLYYFNKSRS